MDTGIRGNGVAVSVLYLLVVLAPFECLGLKCSRNLGPFPINDTTEVGDVVVIFEDTFEIEGECDNLILDNNTLVLNRTLRVENCGKDGSSFPCHLKCQENGSSDFIFPNIVIFTINYIDVYDPAFPASLFRANVSEGVPADTEVFNFDKNGSRATDEDCWKSLQYSFENPEGQFSINTKGLVRTLSHINYDERRLYNLTVIAVFTMSDGSTSTTNTLLEITINDVDNKPPAFSAMKYELEVDEETVSPDTLVTIPPIACRDLDTGIDTTVLFKMSETNPYFTIQENTGLLIQNTSFDRETMVEWQTDIMCYQSDDATKSDTSILHVVIQDINDHRAVFNEELVTVDLTENAFSGSYVTAVTATDEDVGENAQIIYQLDQQSDTFQVNDKTGVITVNNPDMLDRDVYSNLTVTVFAVDLQGNFSANNVTVVVTLLDVNDNGPQFTESVYRFYFNISDVGTIIGTITAFDKDVPNTQNSNVTYSVYQAWQDPPTGTSPLNLSVLTGDISIIGVVAVNTTYNMLVEACDNPDNVVERRCSITRIIAVYTLFSSYSTISVSMEIVENSSNGTMIALIPIQGDHYNTTSQDFVVDPSSHMLKTNIELDREEKDEYNIAVTVFSDTLGSIGEVNITLYIRDMNDNPPVFDQENYFFVLPQSKTGDNNIGTVAASDSDLDKNGEMVFRFQQTMISDLFDLDPVTGAITIKDDWWSTQRSFYQLTLYVSDLGMPPLQTSTTVYISEMSADSVTSSIKLSTVADQSVITSNKTYYESEIRQLLRIERIIIRQVEKIEDSQKNIQSYINITGFDENNTAIPVQEFQKMVVDSWTSIQDLFREPIQYVNGADTSNNGLKTAEIALIAMAGVILLGGLLAIIVVCRLWDRHTKNQRLYDSLRRPSTLYDSQEIRLEFGDENGLGHLNRDYRRGKSKEPEELEGSFGLGYINTAYMHDDDNTPKTPTWSANDTPRIPRWSTSDSLKDAIESLEELTNRLNAEDNISRITSLSRERKSLRSYKSSNDGVPIIDDVQDKHKEMRDTDDYITPVEDYPVGSDTGIDTDKNETNQTDDDDKDSKDRSGIFYVNSFRKQCSDSNDSAEKSVVLEATAF